MGVGSVADHVAKTQEMVRGIGSVVLVVRKQSMSGDLLLMKIFRLVREKLVKDVQHCLSHPRRTNVSSMFVVEGDNVASIVVNEIVVGRGGKIHPGHSRLDAEGIAMKDHGVLIKYLVS